MVLVVQVSPTLAMVKIFIIQCCGRQMVSRSVVSSAKEVGGGPVSLQLGRIGDPPTRWAVVV